MRVRDLRLRRRERLDLVVNFFHVRRVKRELRPFLQEKRRRFLHVFLGKRNRYGRELDLRIPEFQLTLHLFDLLAYAGEFLLDLKQVVDVIAFLFQHVDQTRLHYARILQARVGVEIRLGDVFSSERLVF